MLVIAGAGHEHRPRPPLTPPLAHTLSIRTHKHTLRCPSPSRAPSALMLSALASLLTTRRSFAWQVARDAVGRPGRRAEG